MECLHAMRTLAMAILEDPDYRLDVWSSFYRARMRPRRGSGDHRKLIMPPRRRRNGQGQEDEEVPEQGPSASCQGGPGIVKDVPPLRECGRGTDAGTEVEGPGVEAWITGP